MCDEVAKAHGRDHDCSLMSKKGEFGVSSWNTFFFDAPSLSCLWSTPFFHLQHNTLFSENIPAPDPPIPLIPTIALVFLSVCSINVKVFERGPYLLLHRRTFKFGNLKCHEDPLFHCLSFEVNGHPCQGTKAFDSIGTFPHRFKEYNFSFSLISKSNCPQFLPSLVCLCFSIMFQILVIACKILEIDITHFFSLRSFLFPWPRWIVLFEWLLSFSPSNASQGLPFPLKSFSKGGILFVCFCIYCLPSGGRDSCKAKWIRTPVIVPWCGSSFPSSVPS